MDRPNWGLLEKSQTDNETIEEAIDRLITAHNDDANAHIGEGKSLTTHKTQATIDHPDNSIVSDKIDKGEVSPNKRKWDKFVFETYFETIDAWDITTSGAGEINHYLASIQLRSGAGEYNYSRMTAETFGKPLGVNFSKNPRFMTQVNLVKYDNVMMRAAVGSMYCAFGFAVIDNDLYSYHAQDDHWSPHEYTTEIMTLPENRTWIKLEAVYTSGSKIDFYVDNTLEVTVTTNLPEDGYTPDCQELMDYICYTNDANQKIMYIRNFNFQQDE